MRFYRTLKLLSAIFFLIVFIPGEKLSFPVGLILIMPFMEIMSSSDILIMLAPLTGIFYLVISCFASVDTKRGKIQTIVALLFLWLFLLYYSEAFIKYMEPVAFTTLLLFVSSSACCLYLTIKGLINSARHQSGINNLG